EHSPEKEIGVFPIKLTDEGMKDEKINHAGETLSVGHWHSDMPGLTTQSKILATSAGCPRQIIAYTPLVYGLQCHMEFTPELVELLIAADASLPEISARHRFVQSTEVIRSFDFREMNEKLSCFLDRLVEEYKEWS